ncbi:MAG TPA: type VI secretion system accessory protein TagJ [Gemmatimonadaceae bacterium]|nr:type VI secretion system accessory protein TagJ [Gemmatimonadaceae bacterium]
MKARELFQAGQLDAAIDALGVEVRDNPTDTQRRTFLFELLCFAGQYGRAEKHLDVLAQAGPQAGMGALLYRSALHACLTRDRMFKENAVPPVAAAAAEVSGTINGTPFSSLVDGDPRIGPRLEVFAAGQYTLLPLAHIASLRMSPPTRLRDLMWPPAVLKTGPLFRGLDLGEVILPALTPLSAEDPNDHVRLGRVTEWRELPDGTAIPVGQKMLLVDGEEYPILEVRELDIAPAAAPATTS